jgi:hypothetical protein
MGAQTNKEKPELEKVRVFDYWGVSPLVIPGEVERR